MKLPNLSYMVSVGQLRYVQSIYEVPECRNPDGFVGKLLPGSQRWLCDLRGITLLWKLRSQPFYYYLLARTRYYDAVFVDAICAHADVIINIGCGTDTRAYRFGHILKQKAIRVLECDQPDAIHAKEKVARRHWPVDHVDYVPLDLDAPAWTDFEGWLGKYSGAKALVLMEGVSPYLTENSVGRLLRMLRDALHPQSRVAYDFKVKGMGLDFGRADGTAFRLVGAREAITSYHDGHGFKVGHIEFSTDLATRLVPHLSGSNGLFQEDCLLQLSWRP